MNVALCRKVSIIISRDVVFLCVFSLFLGKLEGVSASMFSCLHNSSDSNGLEWSPAQTSVEIALWNWQVMYMTI